MFVALKTWNTVVRTNDIELARSDEHDAEIPSKLTSLCQIGRNAFCKYWTAEKGLRWMLPNVIPVLFFLVLCGRAVKEEVQVPPLCAAFIGRLAFEAVMAECPIEGARRP